VSTPGARRKGCATTCAYGPLTAASTNGPSVPAKSLRPSMPGNSPIAAGGGWIDPRQSSVTFRDWAAEWLASDPGKRASTLTRDESILRNHLLPALGNRPLATITQRDIQKLISAWARQAAPRTVRRQYDVLRAVLAAVESDLLLRSRPGGSSSRYPRRSTATSSPRQSSPRWPPPSARTQRRWCGWAACWGFGRENVPGCGWGDRLCPLAPPGLAAGLPGGRAHRAHRAHLPRPP
jgi:hypothetical protein